MHEVVGLGARDFADQRRLIGEGAQQAGHVGKDHQCLGAKGRSHHRCGAIAVHIDRLTRIGRTGGREHGQVTGIKQKSQQAGVYMLDGARPVVAQHHALAVNAHAQRILARAFKDAPVEAAQPHRVDARALQLLHPHLVELAAVDHLEDFERASVGAAAHIAALAGHKCRRVAQRLGHFVCGLGAAMHQQ